MDMLLFAPIQVRPARVAQSWHWIAMCFAWNAHMTRQRMCATGFCAQSTSCCTTRDRSRRCWDRCGIHLERLARAITGKPQSSNRLCWLSQWSGGEGGGSWWWCVHCSATKSQDASFDRGMRQRHQFCANPAAADTSLCLTCVVKTGCKGCTEWYCTRRTSRFRC